WMKIAGTCTSDYPSGFGPKPDPVPTLDDDDEIVFMASDAGPQAPLGALALAPPGSSSPHGVAIIDPLDQTTKFVYLFLRAGGSSFTVSNGYVSYVRDANADEWIDKCSFRDDSTEKLGTSNTGYGPNLSGTVCRTVSGAPGGCPNVADGTPRPSTDRFVRDGVTVSTDSYLWHASGRWMVRSLQVAKPGQPGIYGPDLIDRWKGRAFQQSTACSGCPRTSTRPIRPSTRPPPSSTGRRSRAPATTARSSTSSRSRARRRPRTRPWYPTTATTRASTTAPATTRWHAPGRARPRTTRG